MPATRTVTSIAAAIALAAPATAQDGGTPAAVADVTKCRALPDATARLACFDAAAARLEAAVGGKEITVLDREGVRKARRSLFGFSLPNVGLFGGGRGDAPEEVEEVTGKVARVLPVGTERYELVLEDGARWQTSEPMRWAPVAGAAVRIRKAALGSYWIAVERTRTVRGRRVG